jgi:hypothetical protein
MAWIRRRDVLLPKLKALSVTSGHEFLDRSYLEGLVAARAELVQSSDSRGSNHLEILEVKNGAYFVDVELVQFHVPAGARGTKVLMHVPQITRSPRTTAFIGLHRDEGPGALAGGGWKGYGDGDEGDVHF